MTQELNDLQSAGANVVRVDFNWRTLEWAGKGRYDATALAKVDTFMSEASARGLKVIAILATTPPWASAGGEWNDAPSNPANYGDFARFVTARYGTELAAVEAWNEPEINNNLVAEDLPLTYTAMVKELYRGSREGNPNVAVLAGALSYADTTFMNKLYADGIAGHYDGISLHPYADQASPSNTSVTHSFKSGIEEMHADQVAHGDNTPEWITEFGWFTGTSTGAVTEQQQAEYTAEAFALLSGFSYVKGATVYQLRDMGTNLSNPEDNFGLVHNDFTARPAYASFRSAMAAASSSTSTTPVESPAGSTGSTTTPVESPTGSTTTTTGSTSRGAGTAPTETTSGATPTTTAGTPSRGVSPERSNRRPSRPRRADHPHRELASAASRGRVVVHGAARRRSKVVIRVLCPLAGTFSLVRNLTLRSSPSGHFRKIVGREQQLRGCQILVRAGSRLTERALRVS